MLHWGHEFKSGVRPRAIAEVLIAGQCGLRLPDTGLAGMLAPELDPGAVVGRFHDPVQPGAFRGQDEPRDAESLAGVLEPSAEFAAVVDPDRLERVRQVLDLHHPAKSGLPAIPGPALRMAGAEVPALAGLDASAAEPAGLDPVEVHQPLQDAPDGGFREGPAVTLQQAVETRCGRRLFDSSPRTPRRR